MISLLEKERNADSDCSDEIAFLENAYERQAELYRCEIKKMKEATNEIKQLLTEAMHSSEATPLSRAGKDSYDK